MPECMDWVVQNILLHEWFWSSDVKKLDKQGDIFSSMEKGHAPAHLGGNQDRG